MTEQTRLCPQCEKPLTPEEIPNNACTTCEDSIGHVIMDHIGIGVAAIPVGAKVSMHKFKNRETPIHGESHD